MEFRERLREAIRLRGSNLCVGLDPVVERLPAGFSRDSEGVARFVCAIVDATADLAAVFKPNAAFFEALGTDGWRVLRETVAYARQFAPVLVDGKRGDIDSTAEAYARATFDVLGADACTINPFLGWDGIRPFVQRRERGVFVVCRTSNPSAADLQDCLVDGQPLYVRVAELARSWNEYGNVGLVAGATRPGDIARVTEAAPGLPILIPGVGTQGGDLPGAVSSVGDAPFLINASRAILFRSAGPDFADAARGVALDLRDQIAKCRAVGVV
ncbi:MAG: orotidine-5'-phosphate decarboxylase [Chloroflexi bacterium]|nr:orotidine-5'-phosphate decarboxylase [Chloroflexota bacterium]